jgi:hypothetical protein
MPKRALLILIAALLVTPAFTQPSAPAPNPTPEDFVRAIYRQYDIKSPTGPDFTGRHASSVFTPSLVQLIRRDQRQSRGEVGKLDGDPICDCQDPDGLKLTTLQVTAQTPRIATAAVTLTFPPHEVTHLRLNLVLLPTGWRIDDIATSDTPSLRKLLQ